MIEDIGIAFLAVASLFHSYYIVKLLVRTKLIEKDIYRARP